MDEDKIADIEQVQSYVNDRLHELRADSHRTKAEIKKLEGMLKRNEAKIKGMKKPFWSLWFPKKGIGIKFKKDF